MIDHSHPEDPEDRLPQEVVSAWKRRFGPTDRIPDSLDQTILADASQHLSQARVSGSLQTHRNGRRWIGWSAGTVAAALLLFAILPKVGDSPERNVADQAPSLDSTASVGMSRMQRMQESLQDDVDGNGVVNILDAFALARDLERGPGNSNWDQNADGRTDIADVDLIAMHAVTL